MKVTFTPKDIDAAPKGYVRVRITEEDADIRRFVREGGVEWIEIGVGKWTDINQRKFITLVRAIIQTAKTQKAKKIAIQLPQSFHNTYRDFISSAKAKP